MVPLDNAQIGEAIDQLLHAPNETAVKRILQTAPWLTSTGVELKLTQLIALKHRQEKLPEVADFSACRGFLRRCRVAGQAEALATQPGWPLATQGPMTQLLLALAEQAPPDVLIKQAATALKDVAASQEPDIYGWLHYNLGLAYQAQADAGLAEAFSPGIDHFETALKAWREATLLFGRQFLGKAQCNLGRLYLHRPHGQRSRDVETALTWFKRAEELLGDRPVELINVLTLLGDAHLQRIKGERLDNIEQGLHCYHQAHRLAEQQQEFKQVGEIEHNLAVAYRVRLKDNRSDNYEQARQYAERALARFDLHTSPLEWARSAAELAAIYAHRQAGERRDNLEKAIELNRQALQIYRPGSHPRQWRLVLSNLGNLYCDRLAGRRVDNENEAIACFEQVLQHCSREQEPLRWAETNNNLGTVYAGRSRRANDAAYRQAVACFEEAQQVRRPETLPEQARQTALNWGHLAFRWGQWDEAAAAYGQAWEAGENLFQASGTEAGRRVELAENSGLAANTAYCLLKLGRPDEALLKLEQGKTRLLAEALALDTAALARLPEPEGQALDEARAQVRQLEAEARHYAAQADRDRERETNQKLSQARAELRQLIDSLRANQPDLLLAGLTLPQILALSPPGGALAAPLITSKGSAVLVLPAGAQTVNPEHVVLLPDFTSKELETLLIGSTETPGWLRAYLAWQQGGPLQEWQAAIDRCTGRLWELLLGPLHDQLQAMKLAPGAPVVVLPPGGLGLLPLHAAWRELPPSPQGRAPRAGGYARVGGEVRRYFLDDYTVSYAPSAYALSASRRRLPVEDYRRSLLAVINPTGDLPYAPVEGRAVAAHFEPGAGQSLLEMEATLPAVRNAAAGRSYLHFAGHGRYDWQEVMQSGLSLADGKSLTLAELLAGFDLSRARLVTLSACETGLAEFQQTPDEYLGLPAGFLQAGTPGLVSSLWAVADRSTMLLMERFYRYHLAEGLAPAPALRQAQCWLQQVTNGQLAGYYEGLVDQLRNQTAPAPVRPGLTLSDALDLVAAHTLQPNARPYEHPFFWAAFTLTGA